MNKATISVMALAAVFLAGDIVAALAVLTAMAIGIIPFEGPPNWLFIPLLAAGWLVVIAGSIQAFKAIRQALEGSAKA